MSTDIDIDAVMKTAFLRLNIDQWAGRGDKLTLATVFAAGFTAGLEAAVAILDGKAKEAGK